MEDSDQDYGEDGGKTLKKIVEKECVEVGLNEVNVVNKRQWYVVYQHHSIHLLFPYYILHDKCVLMMLAHIHVISDIAVLANL